MGSHFFCFAFFSIALVLFGAQVQNARFIRNAFGGRMALIGARIVNARFISIVLGGRIAPVSSQVLKARLISTVLGGRKALVGAPRFMKTRARCAARPGLDLPGCLMR
jgi:hypothetical protein